MAGSLRFEWPDFWAFAAGHDDVFDTILPDLCQILASYPVNQGLDMLKHAPVKMVYKMHRYQPLPQPLGTALWQQWDKEKREEWTNL